MVNDGRHCASSPCKCLRRIYGFKRTVDDFESKCISNIHVRLRAFFHSCVFYVCYSIITAAVYCHIVRANKCERNICGFYIIGSYIRIDSDKRKQAYRVYRAGRKCRCFYRSYGMDESAKRVQHRFP